MCEWTIAGKWPAVCCCYMNGLWWMVWWHHYDMTGLNSWQQRELRRADLLQQWQWQ